MNRALTTIISPVPLFSTITRTPRIEIETQMIENSDRFHPRCVRNLYSRFCMVLRRRYMVRDLKPPDQIIEMIDVVRHTPIDEHAYQPAICVIFHDRRKPTYEIVVWLIIVFGTRLVGFQDTGVRDASVIAIVWPFRGRTGSGEDCSDNDANEESCYDHDAKLLSLWYHAGLREAASRDIKGEDLLSPESLEGATAFHRIAHFTALW